MLPILLQSNDFILYSYPLILGIAWGLGFELFFYLFLKNRDNKLLAHQIFWGVFVFSWLGSKLMFLMTLPSKDNEYLFNSSFWTGGGFVFYGGLLGGGAYLFILNKIRHDFTLLDLFPVIPSLTIGHAIGRIGCFLAGCCFGAKTNSLIGIHLHGVSRIPTQLIESLFLFSLSAYLLKTSLNKTERIAIYFLSYGVFRFFLEFVRGDEVRGFWTYLTPSQWISIGMVVTGFYILKKIKTLKSLN